MLIHSATWVDPENIKPSENNSVTKEPAVYDSIYINYVE